MLTDVETLKMKYQIIEEISKIYEKLIVGQKIDEERAQKILNYVKEKISPESHPKEFSDTIFAFFKEFPEFVSIEEKVKNMREELLEKIGQETLEALMDEETDTWAELTTTLEQMTELSLNQWFTKLPPQSKQQFLSKFLTLSEDGV